MPESGDPLARPDGPGAGRAEILAGSGATGAVLVPFSVRTMNRWRDLFADRRVVVVLPPSAGSAPSGNAGSSPSS